MYIEKLILSKCNRFGLNAIDYFEIDLTAQSHLFIGRNGCGKSSLIDLASVLPANSADFEKGGQHIIECSHRGKKYRLVSDFKGAAKYYFWCNDENLNPGYTVSAQRELVFEHFGYNEEIHNLVTGKETFTRMTTARRRYWFPKLAQTDYSYALKLYEKLKSEFNSTKTILKHTNQQLASKKARLFPQEQLDSFRKESNVLKEQLEFLYRTKPNTHGVNADAIRGSINDNFKRLVSLSRVLLKWSENSFYSRNILKPLVRDEWGELCYPKLENEQELELLIDEFSRRKHAAHGLLTGLSEEYDRAEKQMLRVSKASNLDAMFERREQLRKQIDELEKQAKWIDNHWELKFKDCQETLHGLENLRESLQPYWSNMKPDMENVFNPVNLRNVEVALSTLKQTMAEQQSELTRIEATLEHYSSNEHNNTVNCPSCNTVFNPMLTKVDPEKLKRRANQIRALRDTHDAELVKLTESYEDQINFRNHVTAIVGLINHNPLTRYLRDTFNTAKFFKSAPSEMDVCLVNEIQLYSKLVEIEKKQDEEDKLCSEIEAIGDVTNTNVAEMQKALEDLSVRISNVTAEYATACTHLDGYKNNQENLKSFNNSLENFKKLSTEFESNLKQYVDVTIGHEVNTVIDNMNIRLGEINSVLKDQDFIIREIAEYTEAAEKYQLEVQALEWSVNHLSPATGLIAKSLSGFIDYFVGNMNGVLSTIWTYPMVIHECKMAEDDTVELDYKFPFTVGERLKPNPDVSVSSAGQAEIIDLAFRLVAMKALGFEEMPLVLDEFGKTFDAEHQFRATTIIQELMGSQKYSQMFMVSHYYANFTIFGDIKTCVLDANNIEVPPVFNEHVIIK